MQIRLLFVKILYDVNAAGMSLLSVPRTQSAGPPYKVRGRTFCLQIYRLSTSPPHPFRISCPRRGAAFVCAVIVVECLRFLRFLRLLRGSAGYEIDMIFKGIVVTKVPARTQKRLGARDTIGRVFHFHEDSRWLRISDLTVDIGIDCRKEG